MGLAAAAVPIGCQLLILFIVIAAPAAFPQADTAFFATKFWPIQITLLSLAISGNAFVDFSKMVIDRGAKQSGAVLKFVFMVLTFVAISLMFSISLLVSETSWKWLLAMTVIGLVGLWLAYAVETDISLIEAGLA
jgi:hypothetical protein